MFEAFTLKSEEVEQKEDELRSEISALNEEHRKSFYKSFSNNLKDPDTYAVLNFFFITGLHHFYLGNHIQGTINLSGLLAGVILISPASRTQASGIILSISFGFFISNW